MATDSLSTLNASAPATSGSTAAAALASSQKVMGKEDFLKLLVTQLRYQDPMAPQDPKEFVAQLAQFSSLEQQINANQNLTGLGTAVQGLKDSLGMAQGVSLLGKTVKGVGNKLTVSGGQAPAASFQLPQDAKDVQVAILDPGGQVVRTLNLGTLAAGARPFSWDARNTQGKLVADGTYTFQVTAKDQKGATLQVTNYFTGKVQEVSQDSQGVWVKVDGQLIRLDALVSVGQSS